MLIAPVPPHCRAHCQLRASGATVICEPTGTNMYVDKRRMPGQRYILCPGSTITMLPPSVSDPHAYIVINSEDEDTQPCVEESDGLEQQVPLSSSSSPYFTMSAWCRWTSQLRRSN